MIGSRDTAAPASSRGVVACPRRRANTASAVMITTASPASGQTSHIG